MMDGVRRARRWRPVQAIATVLGVLVVSASWASNSQVRQAKVSPEEVAERLMKAILIGDSQEAYRHIGSLERKALDLDPGKIEKLFEKVVRPTLAGHHVEKFETGPQDEGQSCSVFATVRLPNGKRLMLGHLVVTTAEGPKDRTFVSNLLADLMLLDRNGDRPWSDAVENARLCVKVAKRWRPDFEACGIAKLLTDGSDGQAKTLTWDQYEAHLSRRLERAKVRAQWSGG